MKLTLTRQQRKLASACATDTAREALMCLAVGKGWVAAADGFVLARMKHEYQGETVLIPAAMMKHFTRCKDVVFTVGAKTIGASNGHYAVIVDRPVIVGVPFPDHVTVATGLVKDKPRAKIAMSTVLFKTVLACVDGADSHVMRLFVRKPSEAMQITAKVAPGDNTDGESVAVEVYAMPMFVDWQEK
jgi:hypothetical protein